MSCLIIAPENQFSELVNIIRQVKNSPSSFPAEYLRNKVAQVFALVFAREYLHGWPTFIRDVMMTALEENITEFGANIYLKILLAIDSEVVDRTIDHTAEVSSTLRFFFFF